MKEALEQPIFGEDVAAGLREEVVLQRRADCGKNVLTPPKSTPTWLLFLRQLTNTFILMLLASGVLSIVAYIIDLSQDLNLALGIILFVVAFGTSFMSFWQDRKSSQLMALFSTMAPSKCDVVRDGQVMSMPASELVPGDIIHIREGNIIPADARLLRVSSLRVECASLTGEAVPLAGNTDPSPPKMSAIEARCLVFSGSICLQGSAEAIVLRTGDHTMIGRIAAVTTGIRSGPT